MLIQDRDFGRLTFSTVPLPGDMENLQGTYTASGRVLVAYNKPEDREKKDFYRVCTVNDDGTNMVELFAGDIPHIGTANGIRWMCFPDNRRILLGDYVMECTPSLDDCRETRLDRVYYPEELSQKPGTFCHWSEIIISPDNGHICWTELSMAGATNYLGRLVREEDGYYVREACIVSTADLFRPDPVHPGYALPGTVRGGEVKQFIRGGRALTMVGNGDSITESVVQALDSEEIQQITNTPGYEETTIFSPDEKLGVVMSPRFSEGTNCTVFGLVPQPNAILVRSRIINVLYMYCVAGVRQFRMGNVGPVLIDIEKSVSLGRAYKGTNLSDPEGKWVYYSPISWHPDSNRAMWNEKTRPTEGIQHSRLRFVKLLDRPATSPVPPAPTPEKQEIPYALPLGTPAAAFTPALLPVRIRGKVSGELVMEVSPTGALAARYENYADDEDSLYNGSIAVQAPPSMFMGGKTTFLADLQVTGKHNGEMKLQAVFNRANPQAPAMLSFAETDGQPESRGYARYDGVTLQVADMLP